MCEFGRKILEYSIQHHRAQRANGDFIFCAVFLNLMVLSGSVCIGIVDGILVAFKANCSAKVLETLTMMPSVVSYCAGAAHKRGLYLLLQDKHVIKNQLIDYKQRQH